VESAAAKATPVLDNVINPNFVFMASGDTSQTLIALLIGIANDS
jgi:hypothetical protein